MLEDNLPSERRGWRPLPVVLAAIVLFAAGWVTVKFDLLDHLRSRESVRFDKLSGGVSNDALPIDGSEGLRKAAEHGDPAAQNRLGDAYDEGRGVPKDHAQAVGWYRKAADQNFALAENNLGYAYEHGVGVSQDWPQAIEWYRKAAMQDLPLAENNLGYAYEHGQGVPQEFAQAVQWYRKAAQHDNAAAEN